VDDGETVRDQGNGLLELDLLGRRAGRQGLLQAGGELQVVWPLEDLVIEHGVPGKLPPKEDRILQEDGAKFGEEAEEALPRHVILVEILRLGSGPAGSGWNQASIQSHSARRRESGDWT
jgi:hypothetical protein